MIVHCKYYKQSFLNSLAPLAVPQSSPARGEEIVKKKYKLQKAFHYNFKKIKITQASNHIISNYDTACARE
jgi:hypothetical protein